MQRKSVRNAVIALFLGTGFVALQAQTLKRIGAANQESKPRAVLIELFTSEGCSSCPPADALLRQLDGKQTSSGAFIVGISEHVTYWNNLGWSDPFSSSTYTERQRAYAEQFHLDSVYTPQMVVNGEKQVVGSDRNAVLQAIQDTDRIGQLSVHIASTRITGNSLTLTFFTSGAMPHQGIDIFAVIVEDAATSNVLRGENSGHILIHVNVAKSITHVATLKSSAGMTTHISMPNQSTTQSGHARHLILFAQTHGLGPVLSVDTRPL